MTTASTSGSVTTSVLRRTCVCQLLRWQAYRSPRTATQALRPDAPLGSCTGDVKLGRHTLGRLLTAVAYDDNLHSIDGLEQLRHAIKQDDASMPR